MAKNLIIIGSGGMAREAYFHALDCGIKDFYFVDPFSKESNVRVGDRTFELSKDWKVPKGFNHFLIAVGRPDFKYEFESMARNYDLAPCPPLIHPDSTVQQATIEEGTLIAPGARLTINITVGKHVIIGLNVTVGHDSIIEDFCSLLNGSVISGGVKIGSGTLIGGGAFIKEQVSLTANTVIGAQAAVVKSPESSGVYAGVPAVKIK